MAVDPLVSTTQQPYDYASNQPAAVTDPTGERAPVGGGSTATLLEKREQLLFEYFEGKGFTDVQNSGLIGNFVVESNYTLSPRSHQQGCDVAGCGIGIAQWSNNVRWPQLVRFARSRHLKAYTLAAQEEFVWHELNTDYANALNHLKAAHSIDRATSVVMNDYEQAGATNSLGVREQEARNVYGLCHQG